ncbi:MAG: RICIN domain-containing protein [Moraxellaceae bacterium]|nr:RICIN domain-containing protein [Moraxellaceae bacterium]
MATWLTAHPKEILFLDLEDRVGNQALVEAPLRAAFGSMLYTPSDKPSNRWETPREMIAKGKRIIVKGANNWYDGSLIWDGRIFAKGADGGWNSRPVKYFDTATCKMDGNALTVGSIYTISDSKLGKDILPDGWVDQTGTIDSSNIPRLFACGVNNVDADRWDDTMTAAAVWSWNGGEPNNAGSAGENCAEQGGNGRWNDNNCAVVHRFACQNVANPDDWRVTSGSGAWEQGRAQCASEYAGYRFAVPANSYQNQKLLAVNGNQSLWLNYSDKASEGKWEAYYATTNSWSVANYAPNQTTHQTLSIAGASAVKVTVSGGLDGIGDTLQIFNGSRQLQRTLTGTNVSTSFVVNDNSVIIRLASDAAVSGNVSVQIESTTLTEVPVWRTLVNGKGKCLDLESRNTNNGAIVHHWSCNGANTQKWWQDAQGRIHSQANANRCIDVSAAGTGNGTKIQLWDCHSGANQVWLRGAGNSLRPAHAPNKAIDIKDAYWGAFDGQDAHLWDGQNSWGQSWTWK